MALEAVWSLVGAPALVVALRTTCLLCAASPTSAVPGQVGPAKQSVPVWDEWRVSYLPILFGLPLLGNQDIPGRRRWARGLVGLVVGGSLCAAAACWVGDGSSQDERARATTPQNTVVWLGPGRV